MNKQEFEKIKQLVENKEKYEILLDCLEDYDNVVMIDIGKKGVAFGGSYRVINFTLNEKLLNKLISIVKEEIENTKKQLKLLGYDEES